MLDAITENVRKTRLYHLQCQYALKVGAKSVLEINKYETELTHRLYRLDRSVHQVIITLGNGLTKLEESLILWK